MIGSLGLGDWVNKQLLAGLFVIFILSHSLVSRYSARMHNGFGYRMCEMLLINRVLVRRLIVAVFACGVLAFLGNVLYKKLFPKIVFVSRFPDMWYPRDEKLLRETIELLFERSQEKYPTQTTQRRPWMICVPHAGYAFSGEVAAAAYRTVLGDVARDVKRVVILSPSHYVDFFGVCIPDFTHYQTPLGEVAVDTAVVKQIAHAELAEPNETAFHREHAIDVQIPWIQMCMPQAKIVPLIIGRLAGEDMVQHFGALLAHCVDASTLVVVSSDFVHYGKRFEYSPLGTLPTVASNVDVIEKMIINACLSVDRMTLEKVFDETKAAMCGKNVFKVAFEMAARTIAEQSGNVASLKECTSGACVAHDNSFAIRERLGEELTDYERVGYAALVYSVR